MTIRVLLFAQLKEAYGSGFFQIDVPAGSKISDTVEIIMNKLPLRMFHSLPLRYAVNEVFQPAEAVLKNNDTLALLSPVSGG